MKKFVYMLLIFLFVTSAGYGAEKRSIRFGLLTKLNVTEEEFSEDWRKTYAPNNENLEVIVRFYDSLTAMQMALNAGEISQMVLPEAVANYLMSQNKEYAPAISLRAKSSHGLAFGFREDDTELRNKFNTALESMRESWRLAALEGMYVTAYNETLQPVSFQKFDGADTIKVAVTGDLPGIDYIAADGTPAGFNTAVLAEIGNILRVNVELVNVEAGARSAALASGRVDVVFWYEVDSGAEKQADVPESVILSAPFYEWNNFLHVKKAARTQESSSGWNVKKSIWDLFFTN